MKNSKGYWIYCIFVILAFAGLLAFVAWLIYYIIIYLSNKDFSNNTIVQAILTLVVTVIIGGFFSKWLEHKYTKKLELYKIQTTISINLIDIASEYLHNKSEHLRYDLICESCKVKLYFPDSVLKALNEFIQANHTNESEQKYTALMDELKRNIKN